MSISTIPHLVFTQAAQRPNSLAISDGELFMTYAELAQQVQKCAGALRQRGLQRGGRFAIWAPNCAEWIIAALGGQALGATLVTLNTRYKKAEAADILRRAKCSVLFVVDGFLGQDYSTMLDGEDLPELEHIIVMRDDKDHGPFVEFLKGTEQFELVLAKADDVSDIIFTSGTTGAPKGVMTTHRQNIDVFNAFADAIGMEGGDRYLIVNPFFHSFGYKAGWLSCLIKGAAIFPIDIYEPERVLEKIQQERISVMPGAPTIFQTLLSHPALDKFDISSLRIATTGAAVIPVDLIRRMHEELGIDHVYSAYGLTESTGVVTLCQRGDDFDTIAKTCGRALPGTRVEIMDDEGNKLPSGQEGEVCVQGFNVMLGYLDDQEATEETLTQDGWLKTGDIGVIDDQGYLRITDRKKDMIIVGGFNVYPAELEKHLLTHPAIEDVAVVGMAHDRLGEVPRAHIVACDQISAEEIIDWCRDTIANYKVPRTVVIEQVLPRNASGKVQKFLL